jgi:hypothetical protein
MAGERLKWRVAHQSNQLPHHFDLSARVTALNLIIAFFNQLHIAQAANKWNCSDSFQFFNFFFN